MKKSEPKDVHKLILLYDYPVLLEYHEMRNKIEDKLNYI